jgi:hypothetical protein
MKAFDVRVNGKRLCVAGIGDDGVLNTMIDHLAGHGRNEVRLTVGGLLSPTEEHLRWEHLSLNVGDKVEVQIFETETVDDPKDRFRVKDRYSSK